MQYILIKINIQGFFIGYDRTITSSLREVIGFRTKPR
jgi:hypothetical protein